MDAGPDDFGGSDHDCGFETGWDRMMREETMPMVNKIMNSVDHSLMRLNDAICQRERDGGAGHTLVLVPHDPAEPVRVSLDGKPVDVSIERAIEVAFIARTGAKPAEASESVEWFPVPGSTGVRARALVPPGGKVGVYLLEFEPGGRIDVHKHPQAESIFVQWGDGVIDTGKTTRLIPGEGNHIHSNTFHAIVAGPAGMKAIVTAVPDWSAT